MYTIKCLTIFLAFYADAAPRHSTKSSFPKELNKVVIPRKSRRKFQTLGDMIVSKEHYKSMMSRERGVDLNVPLWDKHPENGYYIVPYFIDEGRNRGQFPSRSIPKLKKLLDQANSEFTTKTTVQLKEVPESMCTRSYKCLKIINDGGCYSYLGSHESKQVLSLNYPGCFYRDTVIHEFMHALGFIHEQNRPDRDQFIKINLKNVMPDAISQFQKVQLYNVGLSDTKYDYGSVMHYGEFAFSKNGEKTIVPIQLGSLERNGISENDRTEINNHYPKLEVEIIDDDENDNDNQCMTPLTKSLEKNAYEASHSSFSKSHVKIMRPHFAKLNSNQAWLTKKGKDQWLQIDLQSPKKLKKIGTQGIVTKKFFGNDRINRVTEYEIQVKLQKNEPWKALNTVFNGGSTDDVNDIESENFPDGTVARYVRFIPKKMNDEGYIAVRLELYGCDE